ncbi:YeeE/YedE family protein [Flavobacterium agricola]|uniref:YeeE/YedE family protein n=1 Tax=Flavobacterium agricola TaxID=2870839 RepID=A0ABY6M4U1_9FLAO|nr:YeeE/YedE family protein [Flavobacterium agricola]UYW02466.1 YeeE/YedE family protein [Flavobacterium agricola]
MNWILGTWPWFVGGPIIAFIMIALIYLGKSFGFSSNFRTLCAAMGAGKNCSFFDFNWKLQKWNLLFLVGTIFGGYLAANVLSENQIPEISTFTTQYLQNLGFESVGKSYNPIEIFETMNIKNLLLLIVGGLLIGFGTRYAGGCTSGHAISGLSNLQLPSLIAVIGFFIGGLVMVHFLFPLIF